MCVRFSASDQSINEIKRITFGNEHNVDWNRRGDIHPAEFATIVTGRDKKLCAEDMLWGFPSFDARLLVNARAESAMQKKSFAESVLQCRCVIAASQFYEWNSKKTKYTFTMPDLSVMWMAGIYNRFADGYRFTVLTTEANESMASVHDRMPLILPRSQVMTWILDFSMTAAILAQGSPLLSSSCEFEQMTLF